MSFLRRKKSGVDFARREKAIDKEIEAEKKLAQKKKAGEQPRLQDGEVRVTDIETQSKTGVSDQASRERNRLKYKDSTGLVAAHERHDYPTFTVYYLGRIPSSAEYGMEAVEGPVDQLCRLRDKQKLPKVALTFDTEGLSVKEIASSVFSKSKTKKDGVDLSIPLHYITYGVASESHPLVFACISRMAEDDVPGADGDPVLMLYAFLCDKPDVAQKITYWQLQAYIEAYEELKRKKILRNRRKQALGNRQTGPSAPKNTKPEESPTAYVQPMPLYGNEPPPPMEDPEALYAVPKKGYKVKNKGYVKPKSENGHIPEPTSESAEDDGDVFPVPAPRSAESTRNVSTTSEDSLAGAWDVAFERRIGEMNELMVEMDAEKLKKLMISNHPSLAREIYFTKDVPRRSPSPERNADDEDV